MNFFYIDNENYIIGVTTTEDADELSERIPLDCPFFYYKPGDDLKVIATGNPAGKGKGKNINI